MYQMTANIPNGLKIYQHFLFQFPRPSNMIFGTKIYVPSGNPATAVAKYVGIFFSQPFSGIRTLDHLVGSVAGRTDELVT
jgi:hypothetical protein